jgi:two-component system sensor histidine kinase/response regulator
MQHAPIPTNEEARLAALYAYEILDTPADAAFDRITAMASKVLDVPICMLSLVDRDRQWFKSVVGFDTKETDRNVAFCAHTIMGSKVLLVEDASRDPRFWSSPLVTGPPHLKFYAGVPLCTPDGLNIGALCVNDIVPRTLTEDQIETLTNLAALTVDLIELQIAAKRVVQSAAERERVAKDVERLSLVARKTFYGVLMLDCSGRVDWVNEGFSRITGLTDQDLVGRSLIQVLPGIGVPRDTCDQIEVSISNRLPFASEIRMHSETALSYGLSFSLTPLQDEGSENLTGFMVIACDITERMQSLAALNESEERFRLAVSSIHDGLILQRADGSIRICNHDMREKFGVSPEAMIGQDDGCHPWTGIAEDGTKLIGEQHPMRMTLANGIAHHDIIVGIENSRQSIVWFSINSTPLFGQEDSAPYAAVATFTDITERKHAEIKLRESEERYKRLFTTANESIMTIDSTYCITMANERCSEMLGYSNEELIGMPLRQLFFSEDETAFDLLMIEHTSGQFAQIDWRYRRKDGSELWTILSISPTLDDQGNFISGLGMMTDITQRKEMEDEVAAANESLEQRNWDLAEARDTALRATQLKSEFVANTSHEIRTPLNGVIGMLQLMQLTSLDERQQFYTQTARQSAESLLVILNDILDFSKMEVGKLEIEEAPFSLCDLLEGCASLMAPKALEKQIEIHSDLPANILGSGSDSLIGDASRLKQIINNLLSNAIKFSHSASQVVLQAELISETSSQAHWKISVVDTGIGIPLERQSAIFESFTQADGSTTRKFGGTGLGLTICRQLVSLMGGKIGIKSAPGEGATFSVEITLEKRSFGIAEQYERSVQMGGVSVLPIISNPSIKKLVEGLISEWGGNLVDCADCLREVQTAARRNNAQANLVVIADYETWEGKSGQLSALADADDGNSNLNIVLLVTPTNALKGAVPLIGGRTAVFVDKPIRQSELFNALRECVRNTKSDSSNEGIDGMPAHLPAAFAQSANVLVMEDDPVSQQVAQLMLEQCGFLPERIFVRDKASDGLDVFMTHAIDLIFTDLNLNDSTGIEFTMKVREHERLSGPCSVPIIAMTASAKQQDKVRCLTAGMSEYISKPINLEILRKMVNQWISRQQSLQDSDTNKSVDRSDQTSNGAQLMLDPGRMAEISGGNAGFERRIFEKLLESTPKFIGRCKLSLEMNDLISVEHWAHTMKGSFLTVGANPLGELCQTMETLAKQGDAHAIGSHLNNLEADWATLAKYIHSRYVQNDKQS